MIQDAGTSLIDIYCTALQRLDAKTRQVEAEWGMGALEAFAPAELAAKFRTHWERLNQAITDNNMSDIVALADGAVRGWDALEKYALDNGHKKHAPDYWECQVDGVEYRVVKSNYDTHAGSVKSDGVVVVSLPMLILAYHYVPSAGAVIKTEDKAVLPMSFFLSGGDKLPI